MGSTANTTRPHPIAAPVLHSRAAVARCGSPSAARKELSRCAIICRKLKPMASRNSRNMTVSRLRSSLRLKRTDSPRAARPARDCDTKSQTAESRKRENCKGRSMWPWDAVLNAFNDSYSLNCCRLSAGIELRDVAELPIALFEQRFDRQLAKRREVILKLLIDDGHGRGGIDVGAALGFRQHIVHAA